MVPRPPKLSYSSVVATIALFLALGGTVYATTQLPKNSVGPKQLRKNAVVSSKVKKGSLLSSDFKAGQLPRGPQGPAGSRGPVGAQGPAGATGPRGPGAVKLHLDANGDSQMVTLGTAGPWTFRAMCEDTGGVSVPTSFKLFVDGPGSVDVTSTFSLNEEAASAGLTHVDLTAGNEVFSTGLKAPDKGRTVGTMIISAGPADPVVTVPFSLLTDEGAEHCTFAGSAVAAG